MNSLSQREDIRVIETQNNTPFSQFSNLSLTGDLRLQVVGGGFSGTLAVIRLLQTYADQATPDATLSIDWYDAAGAFCRGLPYRHQQEAGDDKVFILNQPASRMSPFPEDPGHYTRWLAKNHLFYGDDSFTPRAIFGDYLEDCCLSALRKVRAAGFSVDLTLHFEKISTRNERSGDQTPCILALGHHERDSFAHLNKHEGYIGKPYEVNAYRKALRNLPGTGDLLIVGGGASMIDAIRAAEHCGFTGRYQVISSTTSLPWPFDPAKYGPEKDGYELALFSDRLWNTQPSFRALIKILRREIEKAEGQGRGEGHVYGLLDPAKIDSTAAAGADGDGLRAFARHIAFLKGIPTPPENVELIKGLRRAGRLQYVKGRAVAEESSFDEESGGFKVPVLYKDGTRSECYADCVVNAARFSRQFETETARRFISHFSEDSSGVFCIGPSKPDAANSFRTWGVESFRDEIFHCAQVALRFAEFI